MDEYAMKIIITSIDASRQARATFTWHDGLEDCGIVAYGFSDEELDAMITANAHEGCEFSGFNVELV